MEDPLALRQGIYYVRSPSNSHIDKSLEKHKTLAKHHRTSDTQHRPGEYADERKPR